MRHSYWLIVITTLILDSCKKDNQIENTPQNNYKVLWTDFKNNYPAFSIHNINWDSVYSVDFPKITNNISENAFLDVVNSSLLTLNDAHSFMIINQKESANYYDIFVRQKPFNFISWNTIFTKYVQLYKTNNSNACLAYGKVINQNIGYFLVESCAENTDDYYMIDSFLSSFKDAKGIIIDIRQNPGGNSKKVEIIASRLTTKSMLYEYVRYRESANNNDLTDFQAITFNPDGLIKYTNKVILLTNRHTFSAAENFTLMLRSLSNVIQIGDTTFGGVATSPEFKELPNGWEYAIPTQILCDNNKIAITNGIAPHIPIWISKSDSINGNDRILEKAIEIINGK